MARKRNRINWMVLTRESPKILGIEIPLSRDHLKLKIRMRANKETFSSLSDSGGY